MVVSLIRSWLDRASVDPETLLWSKGYARHCDVAGPESYWLAPTESRQDRAFFDANYRDARGVVWVRLGTVARDGMECDLDRFVASALPTIRAPFALVTTDGDATVPRDLRPGTVGALLSSPWLVSWHTQNHDGHSHPKLFPIPIGLDLHSVRGPARSPRQLAATLDRIRRRRIPVERQPLRVFTDLNKSQYTAERRAAVAALRGCAHVDFLRKRVSQAGIWRRYARYPFVLSAPGNGLDCHRTWELLYLGSIVITTSTSLDPLFQGLPVVVVEDWNEARDPARLRAWRERFAPLTEQEASRKRLDPRFYMDAVRSRLGASGTGGGSSLGLHVGLARRAQGPK